MLKGIATLVKREVEQATKVTDENFLAVIRPFLANTLAPVVSGLEDKLASVTAKASTIVKIHACNPKKDKPKDVFARIDSFLAQLATCRRDNQLAKAAHLTLAKQSAQTKDRQAGQQRHRRRRRAATIASDAQLSAAVIACQAAEVALRATDAQHWKGPPCAGRKRRATVAEAGNGISQPFPGKEEEEGGVIGGNQGAAVRRSLQRKEGQGRLL